MSKPIVLVTETEFRRGEPAFAADPELDCIPAPGPEPALGRLVAERGARYVVVGGAQYRGDLYATLPRGGVIARFGVGHDNIDKVKATAAGLLCTNTPDVLHQSVAELTMTMIGAAARHVLTVANALRDGRWAPRQGTELEGKTLVLVGCGTIAQATARIAVAGYGMRAIGVARRVPDAGRRLEHFDRITDDFADAVRDADFVSLHIPGHPENVRFLSRERLAQIPPRAWIVNTARGAVIDEAALFEALAEGRIAGAALDVFEREPYEPRDAQHDLRTLPNVLLVPHIGSNTADANRRMAERALRNIRLAVKGDLRQLDLINPDVLS